MMKRQAAGTPDSAKASRVGLDSFDTDGVSSALEVVLTGFASRHVSLFKKGTLKETD